MYKLHTKMCFNLYILYYFLYLELNMTIMLEFLNILKKDDGFYELIEEAYERIPTIKQDWDKTFESVDEIMTKYLFCAKIVNTCHHEVKPVDGKYKVGDVVESVILYAVKKLCWDNNIKNLETIHSTRLFTLMYLKRIICDLQIKELERYHKDFNKKYNEVIDNCFGDQYLCKKNINFQRSGLLTKEMKKQRLKRKSRSSVQYKSNYLKRARIIHNNLTNLKQIKRK